MKVKELIAKLQECDGELEVLGENEYGEFVSIEFVSEDNVAGAFYGEKTSVYDKINDPKDGEDRYICKAILISTR